jgi:hypothetical protein
MRIRVSDVLDLLANGLSFEQILEELPDLEYQDIQSCLPYANHINSWSRYASGAVHSLPHPKALTVSFQDHPEAGSGPHDLGPLFDRFIRMMAG